MVAVARPPIGGPAMSRTVELPDDLAESLSNEALRQGLSLPDYTVRLLRSTHPSAALVRSGADLVAFWRSEGLIGSRPDIADSQAQARSLRDQAQLRPTRRTAGPYPGL